MNCFNGSEFIAEALESVLQQTYKNWELIFWDNFSSDNSVDIVKSYKNPKIKIFKNIKNIKLYNARNLALNEVDGEFVSFLDVDDYWLDNKLEIQVEKLNKDKSNFTYSNHFIKEKNMKIFSKKTSSGFIKDEILKKYPIYIST